MQLLRAVRSNNRLQHGSHRLVGDTEVARHGPQPLPRRPRGDLGPALPWDARSLGTRGVAPDSSALTGAEQPVGVQERDEGRGNDVYLA